MGEYQYDLTLPIVCQEYFYSTEIQCQMHIMMMHLIYLINQGADVATTAVT